MHVTSLFGTDGIRGLVNQEPMTAQTILKVGQALGCVIQKEFVMTTRRPRVVIGKDTRLSGYTFESALQAGLCSMGVDVLLMGPIPTPAVAFIADNMRAEAGIMITASHNPFYDNGIKIFTRHGFKLTDENENTIDDMVLKGFDASAYVPEPAQVGRAKRIEDAQGRYISSVKQHFLQDETLEGMKIVVDCAHGATYRVAPLVFEELGAHVVTLGNGPNGLNINDGVGAMHSAPMIEAIQTHNADLGIAFDGDGDRMVAADAKGNLYDGDDILSIWMDAPELYPEIQNGIVGTLMTNYGLEKKCASKGISMHRANVGDRNVVEMLKEKKLSIGGESSGHLIDLTKATTGDGLLSAIMLLNVLQLRKRPLHDFVDSFTRYPQELQSIQVKEKKPLETIKNVQQAISKAQDKLKNKGRTLTRYSGTENKIRVMVESEDPKLTKEVLDELCAVVEREMGIESNV